MRQSTPLLALTVFATAIVSAHRFLTLDGEHAAAGGDAIGVGKHDGAVGDAIAVDVIGTAIVQTGGVFGKGAYLSSDANGRAVLATDSGVRQAVIDGGAAGALVLTGVLATDRLISVARLNRDATAANVDLDDLTAEFSISDDDEITNAGGTNTTGDALLVTWSTPSPVLAQALEASGGEDRYVEVLLLKPVA
jgi:hypothetical protein